jgi:carboxypeptidase Q
MKKLILLATALPSLAFAQSDKGVAWDIVEGLTTEVGPRLAGTEAEARARDWAVAKLMSLGFSNVRIEPYQMPTWVRGEETGSLLIATRNGVVAHKLAITALGHSGATPDKGLEGEVIFFRSIDALKAAPDAVVKGKIVYLTHAMRPAQDGISYGFFGAVRRAGPNIAAKKGAIGIVIRSLGTDNHRNPHTGITNWEAGVKPIPAAAVSNPDADNIERQLQRWAGSKGEAGPKFWLLLTPRFMGQQSSGNVIAEIPGSDPEAGIVLVGGHLDSWDLGTGAIDDAAGVAITAGAAANILNSGRPPRRPIRVVLFGSEEVGTFGAKAYFDRHKGEKHALAAESDFGADRVWRLDLKLPERAKALGTRLSAALAPLGISTSKEVAVEGADIALLLAAGVPSVALQQDGTRYFDLHHTPDDTLDKIDPVQFAQNVQAWTIMLNEVANAPENLVGTPEVIVEPADTTPVARAVAATPPVSAEEDGKPVEINFSSVPPAAKAAMPQPAPVAKRIPVKSAVVKAKASISALRPATTKTPSAATTSSKVNKSKALPVTPSQKPKAKKP